MQQDKIHLRRKPCEIWLSNCYKTWIRSRSIHCLMKNRLADESQSHQLEQSSKYSVAHTTTHDKKTNKTKTKELSFTMNNKWHQDYIQTTNIKTTPPQQYEPDTPGFDCHLFCLLTNKMKQRPGEECVCVWCLINSVCLYCSFDQLLCSSDWSMTDPNLYPLLSLSPDPSPALALNPISSFRLL